MVFTGLMLDRRLAVGQARRGARGGSGTRASPPPRSSSSSTSATSRCGAPARPPTSAASAARSRRSSRSSTCRSCYLSVTWWQTLHQTGTVFNAKLDVKIDGSMAFTLVLAVVVVHDALRLPRARAVPARRARRRARGTRAASSRSPSASAPRRWSPVSMSDNWGYVVAGYAITAAHARRRTRCGCASAHAALRAMLARRDRD